MVMGLGSYASRVVATKVVALDGTGDFTTIQAAINDLPAGGGVVYIKEGIYTITSVISITSDNVALIGAGKSTQIKTTTNINIVLLNGVEGCLIDSLYIYGSGTGAINHGIILDTSPNNLIINCWIENCGGTGIITAGAGSHGNIIYNNHVYANQATGIGLISANKCVVDKNIIYNNEQYGISVGNGDDNIISGNLVYDNDYSDTATYSGISLYQCDYTTVIGNRCKDNDNYEIILWDTGTACDRNIVVGNLCYGTDHVGAIDDNGTNTEIAHNIIA